MTIIQAEPANIDSANKKEMINQLIPEAML